MKITHKLYFIVAFSFVFISISFLFMNVFSIQQAVELCKDVGGQPQVNNGLFSFSCEHPSN
ncbi:hypothetical protein CR203_12085 [Salipaludibacillus neizhouensis]|uniref:Uncharacterized protein n=1 Tax=Salipaludibacillus neizhouensis TaxID=885475 RepID=A0A3A9K8U3_9BACI|nr:hypothetical protein [Salipaludibacillus neizhouensis]RKL67240.1 hypothetical protein CR203_12085 [Salipaludibacillus neizhouensis]